MIATGAVDAADDDGFDLSEFADAIPLADEPAPPSPSARGPEAKRAKPEEETIDLGPEPEAPAGKEDDAVAQFLMDLKLDEED